MDTHLRSLSFIFAAVFVARSAAAQPQATDVRAQLQEPARRAWDAAKQLAGASDYKGALVEFERAYDLSQIRAFSTTWVSPRSF